MAFLSFAQSKFILIFFSSKFLREMTKIPLWQSCKLSATCLDRTNPIDRSDQIPHHGRRGHSGDHRPPGRRISPVTTGGDYTQAGAARLHFRPAKRRRSDELRPGGPLFEAMAVSMRPCLLAVAFFAAAWVSCASSVPAQVRVGGLDFFR